MAPKMMNLRNCGEDGGWKPLSGLNEKLKIKKRFYRFNGCIMEIGDMCLLFVKDYESVKPYKMFKDSCLIFPFSKYNYYLN